MQGRALSQFHLQIGAAIREQRTALGLTQAALAARLDRDAAFVGRAERSAQNIEVQTLWLILTALNPRPRGATSLPRQEPAASPASFALLQTFAQALGFSDRVIKPPVPRTFERAEGPGQAQNKAADEINPTERRLMEACLASPRSATELQKALGYKTRPGNFKVGLNKLLARGHLQMSMPTRRSSRYQKYRLTAKGRAALAAQTT
jgi:transcriptional regulator with XRE-family HTH domain